jgi:energy-coupling factor transporter ATP-binding protein EcfA2
MDDFRKPRWAQEIEKYLYVKSQFVLIGNVSDIYALEGGDDAHFNPLSDSLVSILRKKKYEVILDYTPLTGFRELYIPKNEKNENIYDIPIKDRVTLSSAWELINNLSQPPRKIGEKREEKPLTAILLNFSSRLPDVNPQDVQEFYYKMYKLSQTGLPSRVKMEEGEEGTPAQRYARYHLIFWLLDKEIDLPPWYIVDNHMVRTIYMPKPDHQIRSLLVENESSQVPGFDSLTPEEQVVRKGQFLDQTGGLYCREILDIVQLAKIEDKSFSNIASTVQQYKIGISDSPWSKLLSSPAIRNAEETISKKVIGQPLAVKNASDVVKRAVYNLSGSQFSAISQKPKGVLFLAGPTGTGKTELAKTISEMIFGSSTNCIRFDMSEFSQEHASQRLVGAPPGYVGYGGGQLTNAILENPFSLVLFDEIEKGHPKIWDIFLQILDDGRLTSGSGDTAYFSESLLVFTSNLGMRDIPYGTPYEELSATCLGEIKDHFINRLGRPEILNRIGNNISIFDFIRPDVSGLIFDKMIKNTLEKIRQEHSILINIPDDVHNKIQEKCCDDLTMGGRGIGNNIETYFINPVSRVLFDEKAGRNSKWDVSGEETRDGGWTVSLTRAEKA